MNKFEDLKSILREHKKDLEREFGVSEIGIFGSCVRGTQRENSDIDVLVNFQKAIDLLTFSRLKNHLSELLDSNVDLVMKQSLKPRIGERILSEVVYV
jgi:predicted nucleotidyltransferase